MTDDQHRIGKLTDSRLAITGAFERWDRTAAADRPEPIALADWILEQLQTFGWRPPIDLTAKPPLHPDQPADEDSPGRRQFRAGLCDRFGHQANLGRCDRCGTELATGQQK